MKAKDLLHYSKDLVVLYVEDNLVVRRSTTLLFENFFKKVVTADNGQKGLGLYKQGTFDIVFTDIRMPVMDGIQMTRRIKDINFEQPVVVISAHDESHYLHNLLTVGVDYFLLKPLDVEKLINSMFRICKNIFVKKKFEEFEEKRNRELEEERTRLYTAIEQASESVVILDVDGMVEYVNPAFENMTGYSRVETTARNLTFLKDIIHEKTLYKEIVEKASQGDAWAGRLTIKKKDETLFDADMRVSPIQNELGELTNFIGLIRDVTYEIKLENQLRQTQKMEAIGTLAGGIAHDFNNILAALLMNIELAKDSLSSDNTVHKYLDRMRKAGDRATDLVKQILTFSRKSDQFIDAIDLIPVFKETLKFLHATFPKTIEVHQKYKPNCPKVLADPTQILQVMMNLCTNAEYAMRGMNGVLAVELDEVAVNAEFASLQQIEDGNYLKLTLSDTGSGMDADIAKRIFDPFFTTKPIGEGTGMGLSVVHGIVRAHKGAITVDSEPGRGTTFQVYLPAAEGESDAIAKKATAPIPKGKGRILLVDDEEALLETEKEMLERLGYDITATTCSIEALAIFSAEPSRFDLIITDQTIPKMTGDRLAVEIMKIRSDIPVILVTGFSYTMDEKKAVDLGIREFLMKPISESDFAGAIQRIFDNLN